MRASQPADTAIDDLFAAYAAALDDADAEAVAALFAFPTVIWQFGEGHVFADADELLENIEALIAVYDEAGIVTSTPQLTGRWAQGAAAFAAVSWRQQDGAGAVLHEFSCGYFLIAAEAGWRIAAIVNEPSD